MAAYRVFPFIAPIRLYADAEAAAAAAASLAIEKAMQAAAGGVAVPEGDLTPVGKNLAGDAAGAGVVGAELDREGALTGAAAAAGQAVGDLSLGSSLAGAATAAGLAAAALTVTAAIATGRAPSPWPGRTVAPGLSIYALQPSIEARGVW